MNDIIAHLEASIADEILSKPERKSLRAMIAEAALDQDQIAFLRSKVHELANQKANESNYRFVLDWVKDVSNSLVVKSVSGTESAAYFSPGETCRNAIIHEISNAVNSLRICVFTISDDRIADAILMAQKKHVDIKIITDNDKSLDIGSDIARLAMAGIPLKMDNTSNHMHHKFVVADSRTLITGSYNWTSSAARFNHENIILTRESHLIKTFLTEFDRLWELMTQFN